MTELVYLDFDLSIEVSGDRYRARVISSPAGEAEIEFARPFSDLELENFYLRVGRPRQGVRRLDSPEMEAARKFGAHLFEAAFGDEVYACFRASLNEVQAQDKGLRLRLRVNAPELSSLPWEYLYNLSLDRFLSLSVETPIVRYLDMPQRLRSLAVSPPLNVLAMISSPSDFPPLDVEREWRQLKEAVAELEGRGLLTLERLEQASLASLQHRLRRGDVHIFHYIGHGKFDELARDGLLLFEGESGRGRPLSGAYLGTILHNHRPLRLAVLNACEGARTSSADPYSGAAQSLVRQGIPSVVAMQFEITDRAAIIFGREFYSAIADGYPVDAALVEARTAIFAQGNDIEWGTPVYFTRAPDGHVFDLSVAPAREPAADDSLPEVDPDLENRLERTYWEAVSAYHLGDWETAREKFRNVTGQRAEYRDAHARLSEVEEQIKRGELYDRAQAAIQAEDWRSALQSLDKLVDRDPNYRDATTLMETVRKQAHLASLYTQARNLSQRGHWGAVISVFKKIKTLQPDYTDPDGLLATAQRELGAQERREQLDGLYRQALKSMDAGEWESAVTTLERLLEMDADYLNAEELMERAKGEQTQQGVLPSETQSEMLEGVIICPTCGQTNRPTASYCINCGVQLQVSIQGSVDSVDLQAPKWSKAGDLTRKSRITSGGMAAPLWRTGIGTIFSGLAWLISSRIQRVFFDNLSESFYDNLSEVIEDPWALTYFFSGFTLGAIFGFGIGLVARWLYSKFYPRYVLGLSMIWAITLSCSFYLRYEFGSWWDVLLFGGAGLTTGVLLMRFRFGSSQIPWKRAWLQASVWAVVVGLTSIIHGLDFIDADSLVSQIVYSIAIAISCGFMFWQVERR